MGPVGIPAAPWHLVVPVKDAERAKTRLHPMAAPIRAGLARAIALDTLEAVCRAIAPGNVLVVTSDESVAASATVFGARVLPDPGTGLNGAVAAGAAAAGSPVAVLLGDLPALTHADLQQALRLCAQHDRAIVPDAEGTGTVLLTARRAGQLRPAFGAASASRHAAGSTVLALDLPRLRRDVDDLHSLAQAVHLGVGRHTAAVLAETPL